MMLTLNNIAFVKEMKKDGITYQYYVGMKSKRVSDGRTYNYVNSNGHTRFVSFPRKELPKTVQKFIASKQKKLFSEDKKNGFCVYIYQ